MGLYDTRTMLGTLETLFPPYSFILDTFYTMPPKYSVTEFVDVDIYKQKRKLAPFVSPLREGKVMKREGYTTQTFKPPYVKPKMESTASDFVGRSYGDNPYATVSIQDRAAQAMVDDLSEMYSQLTRREEWMAVMGVLNGEVDIVGDGVDANIDFQQSSGHQLTDGDLEGGGWDQSGADPLTDFKNWQYIIARDTGLVGNVCVFGKTAWDLFVDDTKVQAEIALFRSVGTNLNLGQAITTGPMFMGQARGVSLWLYNDWYLDETDGTTLQPYIPDTKVLFGSTGARCRRNYGAIKDLDAGPGLASVRAFPKSWTEKDPSVQYVMIQSAPLPVPHDIDAFVTADTVN